MNTFIDEHENVLLELSEARVKFMIVGGYAVIYHGYVRTTGDLDIWLQPSNENKTKLLKVLTKKGFYLADLKKLCESDFTKPLAFHFGELPFRVDFLTKLSGLAFDDCYKNAVFLTIGTFQVPILSLKNLIENKLRAGRMKDQADVDELQKIVQLKQKKGKRK